ncbi:hypothetical protein HMPREF0023_0048 [Acinetobacter sp. ATCC 27244]|nr:hypothetical protein HMPREF0023_0048 [Acinetobacter sp. ATCC 27244]
MLYLKQDAPIILMRTNIQADNLNTRKAPTLVKSDVESSSGAHEYSPD